MQLEIFLSIFTLMFIALGVNIVANKIRMPYTVLLVIVGSFLVPLSRLEFFDFIDEFQLTPEALFFVFLPILIFESAYNMKVRNVKENKFSMGILAVFGLLVSTVFIGFVGKFVLNEIGRDVPIMVTLLFGAIISSTDPVAVLSLFKQYGAPQRLTLIFEGESLFNDATSFALFMVLLDIFIHGYTGYPTLLSAMFSFFTMLLGGICFGLMMGVVFSTLIQWVKGSEHLEITLTLLVAHFTFILTELISSNLVINDHPIHLSSIIATSVSSMVMGNYGRFKMSHSVEEYMEKFWSYFAFVANSLVFILMGLMFANLSIDIKIAFLPILMIILTVVIARYISVYMSVSLVNFFKLEEQIPSTWQQLLSWGSLRGALAIIMVLLIPNDLTLPDWTLPFSIKDFITALTIGCIYFTLLVKATTIGHIIRKLKIDALSSHEELGYYKTKALIYKDMLKKLNEQLINKEISDNQHQAMAAYYQTLHDQQVAKSRLIFPDSLPVIEGMLRLYALSLEKAELKEIFRRGEIKEASYKKILSMLEIQTARVEQEKRQLTSLNEHFSDWFYIPFVNFFRRAFFLKPKQPDPEEVYLYYRTQYKLITKVIDELSQLEHSRIYEMFNDKQALKNVLAVFKELQIGTEEKMKTEISSNQILLDRLNMKSVNGMLWEVQNQTLSDLHDHEIITTKLFISLKKELNTES
jgi:CPA1 family monovalent cation:H+ antiporter